MGATRLLIWIFNLKNLINPGRRADFNAVGVFLAANLDSVTNRNQRLVVSYRMMSVNKTLNELQTIAKLPVAGDSGTHDLGEITEINGQ